MSSIEDVTWKENTNAKDTEAGNMEHRRIV